MIIVVIKKRRMRMRRRVNVVDVGFIVVFFVEEKILRFVDDFCLFL